MTEWRNATTELPNRIWVSADLTYWIEDPLGLSETDIEYTRTDIADARVAELEAALPDMIKPLVWEGILRFAQHYKSMADGRTYHIYSVGDIYHTYIGHRCSTRVEFRTLEEAQAAANEHHRAAIMAAFTGETT
jgi:hypothetical protein